MKLPWMKDLTETPEIPKDAEAALKTLFDHMKNPPPSEPGHADPHAPGVFGGTGGTPWKEAAEVKAVVGKDEQVWIQIPRSTVESILKLAE